MDKGCGKRAPPKLATVEEGTPDELPLEYDSVPQTSVSKPTIPKLKIHLAPKAIKTTDMTAESLRAQDEDNDSPITPPPLFGSGNCR